ncbi:MAG: ATP-binding protein [Pseudomonadota bacterium]
MALNARLTITRRLFFALTLTSLAILALNVAAWRWNFHRGFLNYVARQEAQTLADTASALADVYARDGSWSGIANSPRRWQQALGNDAGPPGPRRPGPGFPPDRRRPPPGAPPPTPDSPAATLGTGARLALLDADGRRVIGPPGAVDSAQRVPIDVDGATVGFLTMLPQRTLTNPVDQAFADDQEKAIVVIAIASLLLAAAISAALARHLTKPLRSLRDGARSMTAGRFDTRIDSERSDELGDLARDFNRLAETLEKNRQSRRQWVADIAHELRTPLAVLRAELDALEDGVREFDDATRQSLQADVARLTTLVGDLRELSEHDEGGLDYRFETVDLSALVDDALRNVRNRLSDAGIALEWQAPEARIAVTGDATRLDQLVANLVENSVRYTDAPGTLTVNCRRIGDRAEVIFSDTAPGVPDAALPKLFDRLYRVDTSRSRATGGSGLGLSICQAIVVAHRGTIEATHAAAGGLQLRLTLPLAGSSNAPS